MRPGETWAAIPISTNKGDTMVDRCPNCDEFMFDSIYTGRPHRCPPAWWCWISGDDYDYAEEDGRKIHSNDAANAAEEYIERWDSDGDYVCIGGDEIQVTVRSVLDPSKTYTFTVHGEMVPVYSAREKRG